MARASGRHSITSFRNVHRSRTASHAVLYAGSVMESRASECARMYAISSAVDTGLVGTITVLVFAAAIQKTRNSGQVPRWRMKGYPGFKHRRGGKRAEGLASRQPSRQV